MNILGKIYLLTADTLWLVGKKENTCMLYLTHFFTLTWSSLSNFCKLFFTHAIAPASQQKTVYRYFECQFNTTIDSLSSHLCRNVMMCKLEKFGARDRNSWRCKYKDNNGKDLKVKNFIEVNEAIMWIWSNKLIKNVEQMTLKNQMQSDIRSFFRF